MSREHTPAELIAEAAAWLRDPPRGTAPEADKLIEHLLSIQKALADTAAHRDRLHAEKAELVATLQALLQFNEELCYDIGVSKHYPSAGKARAILAKVAATEKRT